MQNQEFANEFCALCGDDDPCVFHRARDVKELYTALATVMRKKAAEGLANFLLASFAGVEAALPPAAKTALANANPSQLLEEFEAIFEQESLTTDDHRRLAAVALSIAFIFDAQESSEDISARPIRAAKHR